ncbi:MAG: TAXI family TRAP transporter solute-binding subunit [Deltaproteobacteria bacterium]|nr:MAG: TAXI family TRAP transporter solute-binding subunit [Deltaproteobacteria bacterium]
MRDKRFLILFVFAVFVSVFINQPALNHSMAGESGDIPKMIGIGSLRVGGAGHLMASTLGEVFQKKVGIKVRVIPIASDMGRLTLLRSGDIQFEITAGSQMYPIQLGLADYCKLEWGPQPLQMAWLGPAYLGVLTTNAHKDINKVADVKGKRVAWMPLRSSQILHEAFLAFAGLTKDDVTTVPVNGYIGQFMALMAGKVDVVLTSNPVTSKLFELEARPEGIKWLPYPHADKEGWKRLRKIAPWGAPATVTVGAGITKEKSLEAYDHFYGFAVYERTSPDLVYLLTKTIAENIESLQKVTKAWAVYTIDKALDTKLYPHAYHRGSVKYFKEKGLWSDEHEKRNQSIIEQQKELIASWEPTVDQAISEKWKPEQLRTQWYKKQATISGYTPID